MDGARIVYRLSSRFHITWDCYSAVIASRRNTLIPTASRSRSVRSVGQLCGASTTSR